MDSICGQEGRGTNEARSEEQTIDPILWEEDDPDQLPDGATQMAASDHRKRTKEYTEDIISAYETTRKNGE